MTEPENDEQPKETFYSRKLGLSSSSHTLNPKLVEILSKLEENTFRASDTQYNVFKKFDKDHDGSQFFIDILRLYLPLGFREKNIGFEYLKR